MRFSALSVIALASSASAFAPSSVGGRSGAAPSPLKALELDDIMSEINYKPGQADTSFAKRFGHLAGAEVRTVGDAFAEFSSEFGLSVNALYKNMVTDLVGTTHLVMVNARFTRDPIWSLGVLESLDMLLKNYPDEEGVAERLVSAFFKSMKLDEDEIRSEAKMIVDWATGKTKEEIEEALATGSTSTPLSEIAAGIKSDEFWMYSRYFGLGMVKLMETVGIEQDKDEVYPVMEDWMSKLGKSHISACADSDLYFRVKSKIEMMETLMKEIEIREKKKMAERLERKAEMALAAAEREEEMQAEIDKESELKKVRERAAEINAETKV